MKFNDKIVCSKFKNRRGYHVEYTLWRTESKTKLQIPKPMPAKITNVCFSGLIGICNNANKHNRIYYKPRLEPDKNILTKDCAKEWIVIAVKNGLLPEYVKPSGIDKGFVLNLDNLSPSLLYVYLCMIRFVEEDPDFVRSTVYLVSKKKMNMYAAIVIGTMLMCSNSGHHFFRFTKQFGVNPNINRCSVDLKYMISLKRFIDNSKKYDKRLTKTASSSPGMMYGAGFMGQLTIEPISKVAQKVKASHVYNKHILAAINSKTDTAALKHIEAFRKDPEHEEEKATPTTLSDSHFGISPPPWPAVVRAKARKKTRKVAKKKIVKKKDNRFILLPDAKKKVVKKRTKKVAKKKIIRKRNLK